MQIPRLGPAALCLLAACASRDQVQLVGAPGSEPDEPGESAGDLAAHFSPSIPFNGALDPFERRCGVGTPTRDGVLDLARLPYLQNMAASSVSILYRRWEDPAEPDLLEVTDPAGNRVASVPVEVDPGAADGLQRVANVDELLPATYYCYSIPGLTTRVGFHTAPLAGASTPVRFAVFGDSGSASIAQTSVRDQMQRHSFDLMLHTGDIAYDSGTSAEFDLKFFRIYESVLKSVPIFPVAGNHEYRTDSAAAFREVFDLPENGNAEDYERWYSFDWGDIHFVGLDTEQLGAEQSEWLELDLSRNTRRWTVAYFHRPPFSSGVHGSASDVEDALVPILERHHVPVVFSGHEHDYERTLPLNGITYVITGGGGKSIRSVGHSDFTAYSDSVMHFVLAEVDGDVMHVRAIDAAGTQFDSVEITR